jgi:hypothetical protein
VHRCLVHLSKGLHPTVLIPNVLYLTMMKHGVAAASVAWLHGEALQVGVEDEVDSDDDTLHSGAKGCDEGCRIRYYRHCSYCNAVGCCSAWMKQESQVPSWV